MKRSIEGTGNSAVIAANDRWPADTVRDDFVQNSPKILGDYVSATVLKQISEYWGGRMGI